jgi:hypothetical protein
MNMAVPRRVGIVLDPKVEEWINVVLAAAKLQEPAAELDWAPINFPYLNFKGRQIALNGLALAYSEALRLGATPEQVLGAPLNRVQVLLVRSDQLAALEKSRDETNDPASKAQVQAQIDRLKADWAAQDEAAKPKPPAPAVVSAASDAWRHLPIGTFVTIDGVNYVIGDAGGCGTMLCKRKAPPVAPPPATVVQFKADCVDWVQRTVATIEDEEAQNVLLSFLKWLGTK